MLFVQGEIDNQKYTRKDGVEIHRTCIIAHELRFLPKTKEFKQEKLEEIPFNENEIENDEIPF
jgi:single-stranded DNA-binding protein